MIPNFIPGYYPISLSMHEIDPKLFIWLLSNFFKYTSNSPTFIPAYYPISLSTHEIDTKLYTWLLSNFFKYASNWSQTLYLAIIHFL